MAVVITGVECLVLLAGCLIRGTHTATEIRATHSGVFPAALWEGTGAWGDVRAQEEQV